ncbi:MULTISPECIES: hypothetical protein [Actinomycetes]|uniref:hypothetical protein n=1 Tax=Actinomycetes TaxID=1760 RepID=UPI0004C0A296|nr:MULTISPECIES: hypothetical protein [Actinomycetes]
MDNNAGGRDGRGEPVIVHARVVDTTMSSAQWSTLLRSGLAPVRTGEVVAEVHIARAGNAYLVLTSGPSGTSEAVQGAAAAITSDPHRFGLLAATPTRRLQDSPLWPVR